MRPQLAEQLSEIMCRAGAQPDRPSWPRNTAEGGETAGAVRVANATPTGGELGPSTSTDPDFRFAMG
jgi:hypothetical protein